MSTRFFTPNLVLEHSPHMFMFDQGLDRLISRSHLNLVYPTEIAMLIRVKRLNRGQGRYSHDLTVQLKYLPHSAHTTSRSSRSNTEKLCVPIAEKFHASTSRVVPNLWRS